MLKPARPTIDSVTTIGADGSRPFIYPADVKGRFATARKLSALALIVFYLSLPWIQIGGFPAVFLDIAARRFHLFGLTFAAQDMWLSFFLITGLGFALFFITALFGRIWCGWACPQTVFLDHVYRRIERWVDGNAVARRKLAAAPWTGEKIAKRTLKHALYLLTSLIITHLFLAYYVSLKSVWEMVSTAPGEHWSAFLFRDGDSLLQLRLVSRTALHRYLPLRSAPIGHDRRPLNGRRLRRSTRRTARQRRKTRFGEKPKCTGKNRRRER